MLEVREATVGYGGQPVLDRVSLTVREGEVVALLGPSGSGKSTLLRAIAGLVVLESGSVHIGGTDITRMPTHRRGIGMVFQDEQLFPHRDVRANIAFGLRMRRLPAAEIDHRVDEMLELVGLAGFGGRDVTGLSGGEAKRVALARSLAPAPRALLLDEPLTGLDRDLHDRLAAEVAAILRAAGTTVLLVTHDAAEADAVAGRVVRLDRLQGSPSRVVGLSATEVHDLRRRVLRAGQATAVVEFDGDDEPGTRHLGLTDDSGLVAVSTWLWRPCPAGSTAADRQLRGMAVEPRRQGGGIGAELLAAGLTRAWADGATTVWANARDSALTFYRRHGFEVVGDGFVDPATGIPHHVVRRRRCPS